MSDAPKQRIGSNALSNLVGSILLTLIAIACTPFYIQIIGEARYGILALVWLLFGYFGVFDLGLSRATSNRLANAMGGSSEERASIFWTALLLNLGFGICGALIFLLVSKQLMFFYIKVPDALTSEIDRGLPWIALLIPLTTINGVFVATLEASERFNKLNVLQIIGSSIFQVLPLAAVVWLGPSIDNAIIASAIGRVLAMCMIALSALRIIGLSHALRTDSRVAGELLRYGGWVAIVGIVNPLLATIDQFVIGATIGAQAVAYYSVSSNITGRIAIIPSSLSRALFPRFSQHGREQARHMAMNATSFLANTTAGLHSAGILLSDLGLRLWLGQEFAAQSAPVAEVLFIGMWFNGLGYIPYAMTQGQGRPDLVTKIILFEFLPYLLLLWFLIGMFGLRGAAIAWTIRAASDMILQFLAAGFRIGELKMFLRGLALLVGTLAFTKLMSFGTGVSIVLACLYLLTSGVQVLRHRAVRSYAVAIGSRFR